MKKAIVLIGLIMSLMITGCTKNEKSKEKPEQEVVTTIVYCDSCSEESKEVTKFCSSCGEEAKWLSERPEKAQEEETEDLAKKKSESNVEKSECYNCAKVVDKSELKKFYEAMLCKTCYNLPKNCANGFQGVCEGCEECESESSTYNENFTYEDAIEIAENYYGIKNHPNDFVTANTEPDWDDKGMYYVVYLKSKEMIEQGGNGILFSVRVYGNGTLVE